MLGQFTGWLNSKSMYGQSWSSVECLRSMKLGKLLCRSPINWLTSEWYKRDKYLYPSWGKSLYNYPGDTITFTQRQKNVLFCKGTNRKPKVKLFPWRKKVYE